MHVLPGLRDKILKTRVRGQVVGLENGKWYTLAYVYGKNLKEMRKRKHAILKALDDLENKEV
jgi:hypothetical protein